jgi:hypothetical protein
MEVYQELSVFLFERAYNNRSISEHPHLQDAIGEQAASFHPSVLEFQWLCILCAHRPDLAALSIYTLGTLSSKL